MKAVFYVNGLVFRSWPKNKAYSWLHNKLNIEVHIQVIGDNQILDIKSLVIRDMEKHHLSWQL